MITLIYSNNEANILYSVSDVLMIARLCTISGYLVHVEHSFQAYSEALNWAKNQISGGKVISYDALVGIVPAATYCYMIFVQSTEIGKFMGEHFFKVSEAEII